MGTTVQHSDAASSIPEASSIPVSIPEREHPCWGCGTPAPPPGEKEFKRCSLCLKKKYAVCARFCSPACMKTNWKVAHKEYHKKKDADIAIAISVDEQYYADSKAKAASNETKAVAAKDEYQRLISRAEQASSQINCADVGPSAL